MFAPYSVPGDGFRLTLGLNNSTRLPMDVRPTLYSQQGNAIRLPPIRLEAHRPHGTDMGLWLANLGAEFRTGLVKLEFESISYGLGAQITMADEARSLVFDIPVRSRGEFLSSRLEGIWQASSERAHLELVVSNATGANNRAIVLITDSAGSALRRQVIPLAPYQSRLLNLQELATRHANGFGGISIDYEGRPGSVMANGWLADPLTGFSGNISFQDPAKADAPSLHGAGVLLGNAEAGSASLFSGRLLLRNSSQQALQASVILRQAATVMGLREFNLNAGETQELIVQPDVLSAADGAIGVEIGHTDKAGELVAHWYSYDSAKNLIVETPLRSASTTTPTSGNNPWSLEAGTSSKLYVKNTGDKEATFVASIFHGEGQYMIGMNVLAPGETKEIDIRALRDSQTPDFRGRLIPLHIQSGQIYWYRRSGPFLVGRVNVMNEGKGLASNMSCQVCLCNPRSVSLSLDPAGAQATVGDHVDERLIEFDESCDGLRDSYQVVPADAWESSNWSVASVNSVGTVTCGPFVGSAVISAFKTVVWYQRVQTECESDCGFEAACESFEGTLSADALFDVSAPPPPPPPPSISGGDTVWWFQGRNPSGYPTVVTLTASPATSGPYTWTIASGSDKVRFTNLIGNQVDVLATGSSFSQTFQDVSIKVRVNNQDSALFRMTVRTPDRLTPRTIMHQPDPFDFGYRSFIPYYIKDNLNELLPSPVPINEKWGSGVVDDYPGNNWTRSAESGLTVSNSTFQDEISGGRHLTLSPNPVPTAPQSPLGSTKVHHFDQYWLVGSETPGVGRRVQTNVLQRYVDHGAHLTIVSPAP